MANNTCAKPPELYQGDGTTKDFSFSFQYTKKEDIVVFLWDDETNKYRICTDVGKVDSCSTDPVSPTEYYFKSDVEISFCQAPGLPDPDRTDPFSNVVIGRLVDICAMVAYFYPGTSIRAQDLNNNFTQILLALQDVESKIYVALRELMIVVEQIEGLIQAEDMQDAPYPVWDDESIGTAAADVRYFSTLVQTSTPDSNYHYEVGKTWFKNDDDGQLFIWDGSAWDRIARDAAYKDVINLQEQRNGEPVSDGSVFTSAASAERFDTFVQEETPLRTDYEVGKTWLQNDVNKTVSIWDGETWVGVASGGTFTTQPTTIYVDSVNGQDTNDGHRIINPMKTIKAAVAQANTVTQAITSNFESATYNEETGLATFVVDRPHGLYVGTQLTFTPSTWSCDDGNLQFPEVGDPVRYCTKVINDTTFEVQMEPSSKEHTYVSGGTVTGTAGLLGDGWIIYCAPGIYEESATIEVRARNLSIVGASIRSTFIHPTKATEYNTMFVVDSGFYLNNFTIAGLKASNDVGASETVYSNISNDYKVVDSDAEHGLPSQQAFVVALRKGSVIRKSPYIQNCTNFADHGIDNDNFDPNNLQGEGGDRTSQPTGGGILCDGTIPASTSPLRSFVVDSFTQIALDGPGILCTNGGYAQLVSFFGTFCRYHAKALNGGQLNLSNCTSDFGDYALVAEGKSTSDLITGTITGGTDSVSGGTGYKASVGDTPGAVSLTVSGLSSNWTTDQPGETMVILIGSEVYPILSTTQVAGNSCVVSISNPKPQLRSLNLGLIKDVTNNTACSFRLQSYISTGGHTFEFVGAGTDYSAHPDYGGRPDDSKQTVEDGGTGTNAQFNGGRIWLSATDQDGQFKVGSTLVVDQKTGYINIDPASVASNLQSDLSPTLGGDLDVNNFKIMGDRSGTPSGLIKLSTSSAIGIASGNTSQRPNGPEAGMFRFNSETTEFEGWNGTEWGALGGGDVESVNGQTGIVVLTYSDVDAMPLDLDELPELV